MLSLGPWTHHEPGTGFHGYNSFLQYQSRDSGLALPVRRHINLKSVKQELILGIACWNWWKAFGLKVWKTSRNVKNHHRVRKVLRAMQHNCDSWLSGPNGDKTLGGAFGKDILTQASRLIFKRALHIGIFTRSVRVSSGTVKKPKMITD